MNLSALIADPTLPIPAKTSKRMRATVQTLREAYQTAMSTKILGESLKTPEAVAQFMAPLIAGHSVESLWAIPLNPQSCACAEPIRCSQGSVDGTDAHVGTILRAMLLAGATSFVLVHNHPSGSLLASAADQTATRRASEGGRTIDVILVDHVIVGSGGAFTSLRRSYPHLF